MDGDVDDDDNGGDDDDNLEDYIYDEEFHPRLTLIMNYG